MSVAQSRAGRATVERRATAPEGRIAGGQRPWGLYILLGIGLVAVVGPFVWMVLGSLKTQGELLASPPTLFPEAPTFDNFTRLFERADFTRFFVNSTLVAVVVTLANLLFCSMAGYALAKLDFFGKRPLFGMAVATLMVPTSVTIVPLFVLMGKFGLVDSYAAVILPFAAGAFGVFLMRQFMSGVPDELLDAARIDGASEWRIFRSVVMPLLKPGLAALGIFQFLATWNNFLWPLVVLTSEDKYTLPVALASTAIGQNRSDYGLLMAGSVLLVVPVIAVFLALQRHFTQSIAMTGLKG
ncbi:MAG: carbohydrate ABC transporter permease [Solirubrobacteraceae bacterium]